MADEPSLIQHRRFARIGGQTLRLQRLQISQSVFHCGRLIAEHGIGGSRSIDRVSCFRQRLHHHRADGFLNPKTASDPPKQRARVFSPRGAEHY